MQITCPFCQTELRPIQKTRKWFFQLCEHCKNPLIVEVHGNRYEVVVLTNYVDVRTLTQSGSVGAILFEHLPNYIERLPMLPEVGRQALAIIQNPDTSISDLVQLIQKDPALTMAILKVANSAYYAGLQEVKDLITACSRLGLKTIANIINTYATQNVFATSHSTLEIHNRQLWKHSIATAHSAYDLAIAVAQPNPEFLFLAGLLHDVGLVTLLQIIYETPIEAFEPLKANTELRNEILMQFHTLVSALIIQKWGLPDEFGVLALCHHDPMLVELEDIRSQCHALCIANLIASKIGMNFLIPPDSIFFLQHPSTSFLNLTDITIATLKVDLADKVESIVQSLSI